MPLAYCSWIRLFLACHPRKFSWSYLQPAIYPMYMIMLPYIFPPAQFTLQFHLEHLLPVYFSYQVHFLFTLVTGNISWYYIYFFLQLHQQMSKRSSSQYSTICGRGVRGFNPFPRSISVKVNLIARLKFELTYYNVGV